ncbi:MAG: tripartite tricarboxylate transporter substrate binding protein [Rhodospirillaceae bacterium]|nr:tripartite tricarboxylate transporter substrate binding protein [Rhodospirillaceae bacterium]MBT7029350.1 tripartite tricarboxylate transporter substrate binding protein [Rhodospirillaceae bacterium]
MNVMKTTITSLAMGAAVWTMGAADARAEWPERPITVVVMYPAGGGTDTVIRTIANEMAKSTGWKINVINKPGAVGGVATSYVLGKKDDGYTWMGAANYNKFVRVMGHSKSQAWKDWQYMQAANSRASWAVRPDSKFKTFADIIAAAKANPGKITISTSGQGGLWHELAAIVAQSAGVTLKYLPYKGGKAATLAGLNGEAMITGGGVHEHIAHVRAGKLRSIQQTGSKDIDAGGGKIMPSVGNFLPGIKNQLPFSGIYNLAVRRSVPKAIIGKIEKAFVAGVNSPAFAAIAKKKFFEIDIRTGKAADRRAAQVESITAATFEKLGVKGSHAGSELGLPTPAGFDKWWPPHGYKPL